MSFISSIQSLLPLPRPENRSRSEIARDLDDEFAFHIEMRARAIESEDGVDREAARGLAHKRFGNIDRIKSECQRIALRERTMLQRVNFALMLVVLVMLGVVGWQVMRTQNKTAAALEGIMADLSRMKFEDGVQPPSASQAGGLVYIDGDVERAGTYSLPIAGTVRRAITAAGGGKSDVIAVVVRASDPEGNSIVRFKADRLDLRDKSAADYTLGPNDHITVTAIADADGASAPSAVTQVVARLRAGRWVQADADGRPVANGASLDIVAADDMRNLQGLPIGTLTPPESEDSITLQFRPHTGAQNLVITRSLSRAGPVDGRWQIDMYGRLTVNISRAALDFPDPLTFVQEGSDAQLSANGKTEGARVLVEGDVPGAGWHIIDMNRGTPINALLDKIGAHDDQWIAYRQGGSDRSQRARDIPVSLFRKSRQQTLLRPGDEIRITNDESIAERTKQEYYLNTWRSAGIGQWHEVDASTGKAVSNAWTLGAADPGRHVMGMQTLATLKRTEGVPLTLDLSLTQGSARVVSSQPYSGVCSLDWNVEKGQLVLDMTNLECSSDPTSAKPEIDLANDVSFKRKIVFASNGSPTAGMVANEARTQAVGDFVVRLFALADPNDPNLNQTIRDFLDAEEKSLDAKHADDPATAGMIRELIAARRKIFEADASALRAQTAEAREKAVTDFLTSTFTNGEPTANAQVNALDVLDHAAQQADQQFADNPELANRVREALAVAAWEMKADDGAADTSVPLSDEQMRNFFSRLMAATLPQANPALLPTPAELDRAEKAVEAKYRDDPEERSKFDGLIEVARERLAQATPNEAGQSRVDDDEFPTLSPFRAVLWKDYTPFVDINGTWGELVSIDGIAAGEIVDFCKTKYRDKDRKRFTEDLVQAMAEMGHKTGMTVKVQIREHKTGTLMSIDQARMSEDNRRRLWEANNRAAEGETGYPTWTGQPPDPLQDAGSRAPPIDGALPAPPTALSAAQVTQDLDTLERIMRERFSYLHLKADVDFDAALHALRERFTQAAGPVAHEQIMMDQFAPALQQFIARFGDAHASVSGYRNFAPPLFTPFVIEDAGGRCVAIAADRQAFVDADHPYLVSMNGVEIERLVKLAGAYVVDGSPAVKRRRSVDLVRNLGLLGRDAGVDFSGPISVELASADGSSRRTMSLGPALREPRYAARVERESGVIEGNIGYIRLREMDKEAAALAEWLMPQFRGTAGLIIDVRGNGGGTRDALLKLLPYVLAEDAPPQVLSIAAYRLSDAFDDDHLEDRFMYRRDWPQWTDAERKAIDAAMTTFKPQWLPPERDKDFSDWHCLVISRPLNGKTRSSELYHYGKPVIVLLDGGCFSATDIFLGAFKGQKNVTLMGTPSSGGSGRKQSVRLPASGLSVSMSSMISYRPDGTMYDLNGVEPDVVVEPIASDFLSGEGATDSQLAAAVRWLLR